MDGIIIVNKEKGYTSHDIVAKVKKLLNVKKVGHTGTLDPNATGVLPILIGEGTKLSSYLTNHDKTYQATLKLGEKRDTADVEGNVIETKKVEQEVLTEENIKFVFQNFIGKQEQTPPIYSAIKVQGKKLYEYARKGLKVELPVRNIEIYDIKLDLINLQENEIIFTVKCSKGTYIRSLCEEIAEKLCTVGYMKELVRKQVGEFYIENAISMNEIETQKNDFSKLPIITMEEFFREKSKIQLNEKKVILFLNGVLLTRNEKDGIYRIYNEKGIFIGIGQIKDHKLKREIVIKK